MNNYSEIRDKYLKMGYKFRKGQFELNLYGIRSKDSQSDKFDDIVGCAWVNENFVPCTVEYKATTDPGKYWLQNPMNKKGCAIMVPGQYLEAYEAGKHKGEYEAFTQCTHMAYVRDNNKDTILDFSLYRDKNKAKSEVFWDIIGTNLHRASEWQIVNLISKFSAGCQIIQNPKEFAYLIQLRDKSVLKGYKKWDYTLFETL